MPDPLAFTNDLWEQTVARAAGELAALAVAERRWLEERLALIRSGQMVLDRLFRQAGGPDLCKACAECCCGCGRHHFTLTNLLLSLTGNQDLPRPDDRQTCPFLDRQGCRLTVGQRPYNCITFLCGPVEERLDEADRKAFYRQDELLRAEYETIAARYPAASLRGLLIALQRNGDRPLLQPSTTDSKLAS